MADDIKKINVTTTADENTAADPFADIKNELATRFELLPEDLQKVIVDEGYQLKLFNIAKAQKLTYEELGTLEMETTMVLLGMTKPADYRDEVQIQLKKNDADIDQLVKLVGDQVFAPIREHLEKLYATKKEPEDFLNTTADTSVPPAPVSQTAQAPFFAAQTATAPRPAPSPTLSKMETNVLASTGVVISDTPTTVPAAPTKMPNRSDVLSGIENPPKAPSAGIVASTFSGATSIVPPSKTTDYTIPKPTTQPTPVPPRPTTADPYREPIE